MVKKLIALSDGHGMETLGKRTPPIPELNGRVIKENEFNRAVIALLDKELQRCGFDTLLVAPTDYNTPLQERTDLANNKKADLYMSIHYDALDGSFEAPSPEGHALHIYPNSVESRKVAECIRKYWNGGTSQKDRGIIESNFHELRETHMPAVLSENGFMDNKREALLMLNPDFQREVAIEHAKGICDYFGVKYVPQIVYYVQVISTSSEESAKRMLTKVENKGYNGRVVNVGTSYKVQVGWMPDYQTAQLVRKELSTDGFNGFIVQA